jgi:AAA domain, putative AbiEii toxin, Type IV TA system
VQAFRDAVRTGGCRAHSPAHHVAGALLTALDGDGHRAWLEAPRASSDASAEWARERVRLVEPLVGAWRAHGARAEQADCWTVAEKTLDELQVRLRQERQDDVTAQLHAALRAMLPDAEVEIEKIRLQGGARVRRGADVRLTLGGRPARLGMLSSGQRNALLLAPLLVLDDAGPFGFLLIDDPVHALDDLRVDHLARELARLADSYQVLVLTHDPRLEEHLRARRPDLATVTLDREVVSRTVRCTHLSTPWETLLGDASQVRDTAQKDGWLNDASQESVVTGLCRAALDGAIRQAAINWAVSHGKDVDEALMALGEARDTRARADHVFALAGGSDKLPTTRICVDTCLPAWNAGAHGGQAAGLDLKAHIRTARRTCAELINHRW